MVNWRKQADTTVDPAAATIGVVSDLHLGWGDDEQPLGFLPALLADKAAQTDVDLMVLNGDMINGQRQHYDLLEQELLNKLPLDIFYLTGNKESEGPGCLDRYRQLSQRDIDQIVWLRGIRLVFLGLPQPEHEMDISSDRLQWLQDELDSRQATTIIFHHMPVADSTFNSWDMVGRFPNEYPFNLRVSNSTEIYELLRQHDEIKLWVSGHTHPDHRGFDRVGHGATAVRDGCLHLACANLGSRDASPEGRYLFVEPHRILVRTRNFQQQAWDGQLNFEILGPTTLGRNG